MNAQEKKQKAIEVAYGEYWEIVKDFVDENGFVKFSDLDPNKLGLEERYESTHHELPEPLWRLDGVDLIAKNNNWISIESEEDLPKGKNVVFVQWDEKTLIVECIEEPSKKMFLEWKEKGFTHFQYISFPLKPIY